MGASGDFDLLPLPFANLLPGHLTMAARVPQEDRPDPFLSRTIASEFRSDVQYRIERLLGEGSTARAYYALRESKEGLCPVVMKIIRPDVLRDFGDTASFLIKKEAVALGRLDERVPRSPYVVRLVDTGSVAFPVGAQVMALPWLALEYVNGGPTGTCLDERIRHAVRSTGFAFSPRRAARAILALAAGLEEIHAVGVVHRDLTPSNILCSGSGDNEIFKVSDFGIARPVGLKATFGDRIIGTAGYIAPEQIDSALGVVGPASDVFAFAAIVFGILSGEHYFQGRAVTESFREIASPTRRSLGETRNLCPSLRQKPAAVAGLDAWLGQATALSPSERPSSARLFAEGLFPWLKDLPCQLEFHGGGSFVGWESASPSSPEQLGHDWLVRHGSVPGQVILSGAWSSAGHCLAVTTTGLAYFDGTQWTSARDIEQLLQRRPLSVRRLTPTTWLVTTEGGRILEVAREGTRLLGEFDEPGIDLVAHDGDLDDLCVFIGRTRTGDFCLCTRVAGRWLRAHPVPNVLSLSGVARIDDAVWLVVGRSAEGRAWSSLFSPLKCRLDPLDLELGRALVSVAGRRSRKLAVAAGAEGMLLVFEDGRARREKLDSCPDLSTLTMDGAGQIWMGSMGSIWYRSPRGQIDRVWHEPRWQSPFIEIHAELGHLLVLSVDGGVLEGRSNVLGPTVPA